MSFEDCGMFNGRPYVPTRRQWNKWDDWLESHKSEDVKFDPVSFKAAMEAAKARGQIIAPSPKRLCRRCDGELLPARNSVHCQPCADWLSDRIKRRNEIVTCICPECGKPFQKRLSVRQVCCGTACMKIRKNKQRSGLVTVKPICHHDQ